MCVFLVYFRFENKKENDFVVKSSSLLRYLADSNCCLRFCRPVPNHSAKVPFAVAKVNLLSHAKILSAKDFGQKRYFAGKSHREFLFSCIQSVALFRCLFGLFYQQKSAVLLFGLVVKKQFSDDSIFCIFKIPRFQFEPFLFDIGHHFEHLGIIFFIGIFRKALLCCALYCFQFSFRFQIHCTESKTAPLRWL